MLSKMKCLTTNYITCKHMFDTSFSNRVSFYTIIIISNNNLVSQTCYAMLCNTKRVIIVLPQVPLVPASIIGRLPTDVELRYIERIHDLSISQQGPKWTVVYSRPQRSHLLATGYTYIIIISGWTQLWSVFKL